MPQTHS